jgi:hypothetical protein
MCWGQLTHSNGYLFLLAGLPINAGSGIWPRILHDRGWANLCVLLVCSCDCLEGNGIVFWKGRAGCSGSGGVTIERGKLNAERCWLDWWPVIANII